MLAQIAVAPLVVENTNCNVSSSYRLPDEVSATPPQMSTTLSPLTWRAKAAPTSPWRSKLAAKASPTPSKPGAISPSTVTIASALGRGGLVRTKLPSGDGALVNLVGSVGET